MLHKHYYLPSVRDLWVQQKIMAMTSSGQNDRVILEEIQNTSHVRNTRIKTTATHSLIWHTKFHSTGH